MNQVGFQRLPKYSRDYFDLATNDRFFDRVNNLMILSTTLIHFLNVKGPSAMEIAADWPDIKWIEEHFGLRHTIEIILFVGGVLLAKYLAGRFWDKKRKAP